MKAYALSILIALVYLSASAQSTKGLSLPAETKSVPEGKTYALIVGISKYRNKSIPQLQYADRDAEAFKNYLLATGVDSNNITLLLNEKATNSEFWASLNFITDLAKQGDKVYIYFSGHGDVENKTVVKDAYLLPYDAPKCVYPAGAIAVPLLKSWIATFSANGIKAVFIADACRSGNLAGGREGMEAAAAMLKDKWQDETKILSCQPGELSLEGRQWGDGRGLFSYELINGLSGMADKNKDGKVTLRELNLYLMDKVPDEASPMTQNPMLFGDMNANISTVNEKLIADITSKKSSNVLAAVDMKGFDDVLAGKLDDSIKIDYTLFKLYMDSNILYRLNKESAYTYYNLVPDNDVTKLLKAFMKRNLASALMNDLQDRIDRLLKNDLSGVFYAPENQVKATALRNILGDSRLEKLGFMSKVLFFEGFAPNSKQLNPFLKIDSAIQMDPYAAYLYFAKGGSYMLSKKGDSALFFINQSIHISPLFAVPRLIKATIYCQRGEYDNCLKESDSITALDSSLIFEAKLTKAMAYNTRQSVDTLHKNEYLDSLRKYYMMLDEMASDENLSKTKRMFRVQNMLQFDYTLKDSSRAIKHLDFLKEMVPTKTYYYYNMACLNSILNNKGVAISNLVKYFEAGGNNFENLTQSDRLDNIRSTPEFKALMKKYFPKEYKD